MADGAMKDGTTLLTQADFFRGKTVLDKLITRVSGLAADATSASLECCRSDLLDARDDFGMVAAELLAAQSHMARARALAGRISVPDRITRDGGT